MILRRWTHSLIIAILIFQIAMPSISQISHAAVSPDSALACLRALGHNADVQSFETEDARLETGASFMKRLETTSKSALFQLGLRQSAQVTAFQPELQKPLTPSQLDVLAKARDGLRDLLREARRPAMYSFRSFINQTNLFGTRPALFEQVAADEFFPEVILMLENLAAGMATPITQDIIFFNSSETSTADQIAWVNEVIQFLRTPSADPTQVSPGKTWFFEALLAQWPKVSRTTTEVEVLVRLLEQYPSANPAASAPAQSAVLTSLKSLEKTVSQTGIKRFVTRQIDFIKKRSKIIIFGVIASQVLIWGPLYLWMNAHPDSNLHIPSKAWAAKTTQAQKAEVGGKHQWSQVSREMDSWLKSFDRENLALGAGRTRNWESTDAGINALGDSMKKYQALAQDLQTALPLNSHFETDALAKLNRLSDDEAKSLVLGSYDLYQAAQQSGVPAEISRTRTQYWGVLSDELIIQTLFSHPESANEAMRRIREDLKTPEEVRQFYNELNIRALLTRISFDGFVSQMNSPGE